MLRQINFAIQFLLQILTWSTLQVLHILQRAYVRLARALSWLRKQIQHFLWRLIVNLSHLLDRLSLVALRSLAVLEAFVAEKIAALLYLLYLTGRLSVFFLPSVGFLWYWYHSNSYWSLCVAFLWAGLLVSIPLALFVSGKSPAVDIVVPDLKWLEKIIKWVLRLVPTIAIAVQVLYFRSPNPWYLLGFGALAITGYTLSVLTTSSYQQFERFTDFLWYKFDFEFYASQEEKKLLDVLMESIKEQDYSQALAVATQMRLLRRTGDSLYWCGHCNHLLGQYEEACQYYLEALVLYDNKDSNTLNNLGTALRYLNRDEESLVKISEAISLDPTEAKYYVNRSATLEKILRIDEARGDLEQAVKLESAYANDLRIFMARHRKIKDVASPTSQ